MIRFEGYERRIAKIEACMKEYGIDSLEEAKEICTSKGVDVDAIVRGVQPICFENAVWAYTLGAAIAIKKGANRRLPKRRKRIGIGLAGFLCARFRGRSACRRSGPWQPGALCCCDEETKCFCFLAGPSSPLPPQKAPSALRRTANKVRTEPLARYPQRLGQRRCLHHQPHQRLSPMWIPNMTMQTGELKIVIGKSIFRRRSRQDPLLWLRTM